MSREMPGEVTREPIRGVRREPTPEPTPEVTREPTRKPTRKFGKTENVTGGLELTRDVGEAPQEEGNLAEHWAGSVPLTCYFYLRAI